MEENKNKTKLSTFIIVLAILVIIIMAGYIYMQKVSSDREISGLKSDAEGLKNTVAELEGKLDSISNLANNTKNENKVDSKQSESNNSKQYTIDGVYECVDENIFESMTYTFSNGRVKFESLGSTEGTYEIKDNKILITYDKQHIDPDGTVEDTYFHTQSETLTIKDNSTILTSEGSKYVKK